MGRTVRKIRIVLHTKETGSRFFGGAGFLFRDNVEVMQICQQFHFFIDKHYSLYHPNQSFQYIHCV